MLAEKKEATIQKHGTAQERPGNLHAPAEQRLITESLMEKGNSNNVKP
jgi:hypothetical protein